MSGDKVFVRTGFDIRKWVMVLLLTVSQGYLLWDRSQSQPRDHFQGIVGYSGTSASSSMDLFVGLRFHWRDTSKIAILIGTIILLIRHCKLENDDFCFRWRCCHVSSIWSGTTVSMQTGVLDQLFSGGFCFGAVSMANWSCNICTYRERKVHLWSVCGAFAIIIKRPEPRLSGRYDAFAILLMNVFCSLIDYYVVESNINKRLSRIKSINKKNMATKKFRWKYVAISTKEYGTALPRLQCTQVQNLEEITNAKRNRQKRWRIIDELFIHQQMIRFINVSVSPKWSRS